LAVIRQGLVLHFLDKNIEKYGLISVTEKGEEFYQKPYPVMLTEDRKFTVGDDDENEDIIVGNNKNMAGAGDPNLFNMLKGLRHDIARKRNLPPFVIFSDPSLEDMSIQYPITTSELKNCQGVGEGKARKFGKEFLELIDRYVKENNITRPDEFVVKSIVNKSAKKVYIIQNIDRKVSLDDIAKAKNMDLLEVIDEVEAIVNSGTKLNLDYYIQEYIDEDKVADIFDYFRNEAESDSITDAMKELGPDYEEEEIKLVRIKFMSDLAN